jgi:hypothetical protein
MLALHSGDGRPILSGDDVEQQMDGFRRTWRERAIATILEIRSRR